MRLCSGSLIKHIVFNIVLDKTLGNELFPLSIPIILKTGTDWPAVRARLCFCSLTDMKYQVKNVSGIFWVNWLSRFKITRFCPSLELSKLNQLLRNSLSVIVSNRNSGIISGLGVKTEIKYWWWIVTLFYPADKPMQSQWFQEKSLLLMFLQSIKVILESGVKTNILVCGAQLVKPTDAVVCRAREYIIKY